MSLKKETLIYHFSVEGETEKWYLNWLQQIINQTPDRKYDVKLSVKVQSPKKMVKGLSIVGETEITHLCDVESETEEHIKGFESTIDEMYQARKLGKSIQYRLGYTNFTFELWIVLHKKDCYGMMKNRKDYLLHINSAYGQSFENLDKYKKERSFKKILDSLTLQDVKNALRRAKHIMQEKDGHDLKEHKGYKYHLHNPSLSVYEIIERILLQCGL